MSLKAQNGCPHSEVLKRHDGTHRCIVCDAEFFHLDLKPGDIQVMPPDPRLPRWVWLYVGDGAMTAYDANKIASVRSSGNAGKNHVVINDDWNRSALVFEPLADVCQKLGIPLP